MSKTLEKMNEVEAFSIILCSLPSNPLTVQSGKKQVFASLASGSYFVSAFKQWETQQPETDQRSKINFQRK